MTPLLDQSHLDVAWHAGQYQALPRVYVQNSALEIAWTRVVTETGTREGCVLAPFLTQGLRRASTSTTRTTSRGRRRSSPQGSLASPPSVPRHFLAEVRVPPQSPHGVDPPPRARLDVDRLAVVLAALALASAVVLLAAPSGPATGASALLALAVAGAWVPILPRPFVSRPDGLAVLPVLGLAGYGLLLATVAAAGIELDRWSIVLAVGLVLSVAAVAVGRPRRRLIPLPDVRASLRAFGAAAIVASLAGWMAVLGVRGFPPSGGDWGRYFLFAEDVAASGSVLVPDRLLGGGSTYADDPGAGVVNASLLMLDGVSSRSLWVLLPVVGAAGALAVYALLAVVWGRTPALLAGSVYAVAGVALNASQWFGLAMTWGLALLPVAAAGLVLARARPRDLRVSFLLGLAGALVLTFHRPTAVLLAVATTLVLFTYGADAFPARDRAGSLLTRMRASGAPAIALSLPIAVVVGAGPLSIHLRQLSRLGAPPPIEVFRGARWTPGGFWSDVSWPFLLLLGLLVACALGHRLLVGEGAAGSRAGVVVALALTAAILVVGQAWVVGVPFEYPRVSLYFGLPGCMLVAAAVTAVREARVLLALAACGVVAYAGLRVVVQQMFPLDIVDAEGLVVLETLADEMGAMPTGTVVTDRCLAAPVAYIVRRPVLGAFRDADLAFERQIPRAREAGAVIGGTAAAPGIIDRRNVRFVAVSRRCGSGDPATPGARFAFGTTDGEIRVFEVVR